MGKCCVKPETGKDEEYINLLFTSIFCSKQRGEVLYNDMLEEFDKLGYISHNKIDSFINMLILGTNTHISQTENDNYEELYNYFKQYFSDGQDNTIKKLGLFLIFNCFFDSNKERQSLLILHVLTNYGKDDKSVKEFLRDLIDINTTYLLACFKTKFENVSYYEHVQWNELNKQNLFNSLFSEYKALQSIAHEIEPVDIIPRSDIKRKKQSKKKDLNKSFTSNNSGLSQKSTTSKNFDEDKEIVIKKFIIDNYKSFKGKEMRSLLS